MYVRLLLFGAMAKKSGYSTRAARKELVRAFINKDNIIHKKDNIYYGGKVFVINSIVIWCLRMVEARIFSLTDMQYYVKLIQEYINDEIDLEWDGENLKIYIKK